MKKPLLLLLLLISYFQTKAQRTIPYPIIFVHGWVGSDETWYGLGVTLQKYGLNVSLDTDNERGGRGSRIDFHLNADISNSSAYLYRSGGPYTYGDVYDYNSFINPDNDVFFINFDNKIIPPAIFSDYSDQAACVKQGFAVGLAIKKVLNATKAKKVILVGHSMGGLAIREYLQNSVNWMIGDNQHHVAKLITIGTPHGGSNSSVGNLLILAGTQERSEAVRDLRHPKNSTLAEAERGVYLFGGDERNIFRLGLQYYNNDVNSDNDLGYIQGLNQKSITSGIPYTCVVGTGQSNPLGSSYGDGVVESDRASLFKYFSKDAGDEIFYIHKADEEPDAKQFYSTIDNVTGLWHGKLTKQRFINLCALDEPSWGNFSFEVELNKTYKGFFTPPPPESVAGLPDSYKKLDGDYFKVFIDKPGILTVNLNSTAESRGGINLFDSDWTGSPKASGYNQLKYSVPRQGTYYIVFSGYSGDGSSPWEFNPYSFNTNFCPLDLPFLSVSGSTTFCQGNEVILSAESNFDSYRWFKDGQLIPSNSPQLTVAQNQLTVNQSGNYTLQAMKCGVLLSPDNRITIAVAPLPTKPTITMQEQPDRFILTSSSPDGNQWYLNGNLISGATSKTHIPEQLGAYNVKVTQNGCSNQSDGLNVKMDRPTITYSGSTTFFEGDSLVLSAPAGYSGYQWTLDDTQLSTMTMKHAARKSGNYRLSVQRGKLSSDFSDPVNVIVNPILSIKPSSDFMLKLYPNPNKGTFWVELPDNISHWEIEVFDISGKRFFEKSHKVGKYEQLELKLMPGTYFLKLSTEAKSKTVKFLIE